MTIKIYSSKKQHILYDGQRLPQIDPTLFDPEHWRKQNRLTEPSGGRGQAFFIHHPSDEHYLLRHYRRGGLVARISQDHYLYTGLENSRPFQEFRLTYELRQAGLPVPVPVAARVVRRGLWYQGDLLTQKITNAQPFAAYLQQTGNEALWQKVGSVIARFHDWGLNHVDLNANNILLDDQQQVWLIDFDRCRKMPGTADSRWRQNNIDRLARSICKLTGEENLPPQWAALNNGYLHKCNEKT